VDWYQKSTGKLLKNSAKYSLRVNSLYKQNIEMYSTTVEVDGFRAIINISSFTEEDFGEYVAILTNDVGKRSCHLQISSGKSVFILYFCVLYV